MSSTTYSSAERGGGRGDTGRMRAAILNQIRTWHQNARWADEDKADRLLAKVHEAPERFISPDPDADYREEASRIWAGLKAEYNLQTENQAEREAREWEQRAEDRERRRREAAEAPEPELGGAPEPHDHHLSAPANDATGTGTTASVDDIRASARAHADASSITDAREPATESAPTAAARARFTRPLPTAVRSLPRPLARLCGAAWVFLTFDADRPTREAAYV